MPAQKQPPFNAGHGRRGVALGKVLANRAYLAIQILRGTVSIIPFLGETPFYDPPKRRRDIRHGWRLLRQNRGERLERIIPVKSLAACRHLKQDQAEGELVRAEIEIR